MGCQKKGGETNETFSSNDFYRQKTCKQVCKHENAKNVAALEIEHFVTIVQLVLYEGLTASIMAAAQHYSG